MKLLLLLYLLILIACKGNGLNRSDNRPIENKSPLEVEKGIVRWIRGDAKPISQLPDPAKVFIGINRKAIYWLEGDINNYGFEDILLVTAVSNEEEFLLDTLLVKRKLLLLTGLADKSFKMEAENINAVAGVNSYGMSHDSFAGINTSKGEFTLLFYGGSNWKDTRASTFKYNLAKNNWFLEQEIEENFSTNWSEYTVDTLTKSDFGTVSFENFNIYRAMQIDE